MWICKNKGPTCKVHLYFFIELTPGLGHCDPVISWYVGLISSFRSQSTRNINHFEVKESQSWNILDFPNPVFAKHNFIQIINVNSFRQLVETLVTLYEWVRRQGHQITIFSQTFPDFSSLSQINHLNLQPFPCVFLSLPYWGLVKLSPRLIRYSLTRFTTNKKQKTKTKYDKETDGSELYPSEYQSMTTV